MGGVNRGVITFVTFVGKGANDDGRRGVCQRINGWKEPKPTTRGRKTLAGEILLWKLYLGVAVYHLASETVPAHIPAGRLSLPPPP